MNKVTVTDPLGESHRFDVDPDTTLDEFKGAVIQFMGNFYSIPEGIPYFTGFLVSDQSGRGPHGPEIRISNLQGPSVKFRFIPNSRFYLEALKTRDIPIVSLGKRSANAVGYSAVSPVGSLYKFKLHGILGGEIIALGTGTIRQLKEYISQMTEHDSSLIKLEMIAERDLDGMPGADITGFDNSTFDDLRARGMIRMGEEMLIFVDLLPLGG